MDITFDLELVLSASCCNAGYTQNTLLRKNIPSESQRNRSKNNFHWVFISYFNEVFTCLSSLIYYDCYDRNMQRTTIIHGFPCLRNWKVTRYDFRLIWNLCLLWVRSHPLSELVAVRSHNVLRYHNNQDRSSNMDNSQQTPTTKESYRSRKNRWRRRRDIRGTKISTLQPTSEGECFLELDVRNQVDAV